MAKMLNSFTVSGNLAKMVELPEEFIINGHVYDKNTFTPKPLEFAPVYYTNANDISFDRIAYVNKGYINNIAYNTTEMDSLDSTISYNIAMDGYFTKCKKTPFGIETTTRRYLDTHTGPHNIIDQDDTTIFVMTNTHYNTTPSTGSYIYRIDKNTLIHTTVNLPGSYSRPKVITITPLFIYLSVMYASGGYVICRYNKSTGALTTIFDDSKAGLWSTFGEPNVTDINGSKFSITVARDVFFRDGVTRQLGFRKYTLDTLDESVVTEDIEIDMKPLIDFIPMQVNNIHIHYDIFKVIDNGKTYYNLILRNSGFTSVLTHICILLKKLLVLHGSY